MKKLLRLLSLILSMVMSVSLFAGCNGEGKDGEQETNVSNKVSNSSRVDLYNFEEWTPDFSCIKLQPMFGVVRRNKDKKYTKSGDYSARLQPIGGHLKTISPVVWFPTSSTAWKFSHEDFSKVDYVSFWMYNAQDVEKNVTVGLVKKYSKFETISTLQGQTFSLKANDWTLVKYVIDFGSMTIGSDVEARDMEGIKGIYLEYEIAPTGEIEEAPIYYIDDITIIKKDDVNKLDSPVSFNETGDIKYLLNFDEIYHRNISTIKQYDPISAPTQKIVTSSEVGVEATSGNRMLQYNFPLMRPSDGYESKSHRWIIPEKMMQLFWKAYFYNPELADPYIIPREEWKDWYLCYDVYNASSFAYPLTLKFYASDAKWTIAGISGDFAPGKWETIRVSVDFIATDIAYLKEQEDENGVMIQPSEYYTKDARIVDSGYLWITHNSTPYINGGKDENGETIRLDDPRVTQSFTKMTYYFDSFRVEHII